jgi:hypothetical protein
MRSAFHDEGRPEATETSLRLKAEDVLEVHSGANVLPLSYSRQDGSWAVDDCRTTAEEQEVGECLDAQLARELPRQAGGITSEDGLGDVVGTDGERFDDEGASPWPAVSSTSVSPTPATAPTPNRELLAWSPSASSGSSRRTRCL